VGIGASAGGLEAFKKFFAATPDDSGLAFVLIQHLDPTHESMLANLLSNYTAMPVVQISRDTFVEPDHVYIIPPNKYLELDQNTLKLTDPVERRGMRMAIDFFFRSLAIHRREKAVGIILSGTGSDGSLGIKAIKENGGLVMVQSPIGAQYDGMPYAALNTGIVDAEANVEDMPEVLLKYIRHPYVIQAESPSPQASEDDALRTILSILRSHANYDFRSYKKGTLLRRIHRRMGLRQVDGADAYIAMLREQPDEIMLLFRDLLIGVTSFFRDEEVFNTLEKVVVEKLVEHADGDAILRIWVPGCASGEEAYSIAILFIEHMRKYGSDAQLQIFATDIDDRSLEIARSGIYPESIAADVSPERLERFFVRVDEQNYQVNKTVRQAVVFAPQNLLSDAPFSKLDLISCRNLLIYLEPEVQTKIIRLFHFALKESGYLLLGPSETIGQQTFLFQTVSRNLRIYRRIGPLRHELIEIPILASRETRMPLVRHELKPAPVSSYRELMHQVIIDSFSPACALISRNYEILSVQGPMVDYLEFPPGELSKDLLAMARQGLRIRIRALVHKALRNQEMVVDSETRVLRNGSYVPCKVTVRPLTEHEETEDMLLVAFEDREDASESTLLSAGSKEESSLVKQLEYELSNTREDLQSTIEEMESSNEELKASNEEVMSMNEELQSTNEELETSKEELQSLNEELSTVNSQLQEKVTELDKTNNDMSNLLASTDIATIFLDLDKCIKRFTPITAKLLNLIESDVGRPISNFSSTVVDNSLFSDIDQVLDKLIPQEKEILADNGEWYLRRITPYRTQDNRIEGVVVTFVEITERKQFEEQLRAFNETLEHQVEERTAEVHLLFQVVEQNSASVVVTDRYANIEYVNPAFEQNTGYPSEEVKGKNPKIIQSGNTPRETYRKMWEALSNGKAWQGEIQNRKKNGDLYWASSLISPVLDANHDITHYVEIQEDITEFKEVLKTLAQREYHLQALVDHAAEAIITTDGNGNVIEFNPEAQHIFGYSAEEIIGLPIEQLMHRTAAERADCIFYSGNRKCREVVGLRKDGSRFPMEIVGSEIDHLGLFVVLMRDITERRELEKDVIETSTLEQERIGRDIHDGIGQQLTGLGLLASSLHSKLLKRQCVPEAETAADLIEHLKQASKEAAALSLGLSPIQILAEGLVEALTNLAERTQHITGIRCSCRCELLVPELMPGEFVSMHLYRIAQEAVHNAIKHSQANKIEIEFEHQDNELILVVRDDGIGFQPVADEDSGRRLGLHIMKYRANSLGALLDISSNNAGGTEVRCSILVGK
jgi:two-component system CheB/CheR fusion protein